MVRNPVIFKNEFAFSLFKRPKPMRRKAEGLNKGSGGFATENNYWAFSIIQKIQQ